MRPPQSRLTRALGPPAVATRWEVVAQDGAAAIRARICSVWVKS
jgi:hypothetical protein